MPQPASAESNLASVSAATQGDREAFEELYQRYAQSVYNLTLRSVRNAQLAEDLCQEIWVKAYQELMTLRDPMAFPAWLYRIAARACVDAARKQSSIPLADELSDDLTTFSEGNPELTAVQREQGRLMWEALSALPPHQHLALFLKEVEGRSYREIAAILEISESAVESLLFRGRSGFAKAYDRLEITGAERCQRALQAMAALIDGEATPVQERAISSHLDGCQSCWSEMQQMRRATAAYGCLPLVIVPALLGERVFEAVGPGLSGGGAAGITKLIALAMAKGKFLAMTLAVTGTITVADLIVPIDSSHIMGGESVSPGSAFPVASTSLEAPEVTITDPVAELPTVPADTVSRPSMAIATRVGINVTTSVVANVASQTEVSAGVTASADIQPDGTTAAAASLSIQVIQSEVNASVDIGVLESSTVSPVGAATVDVSTVTLEAAGTIDAAGSQ